MEWSALWDFQQFSAICSLCLSFACDINIWFFPHQCAIRMENLHQGAYFEITFLIPSTENASVSHEHKLTLWQWVVRVVFFFRFSMSCENGSKLTAHSCLIRLANSTLHRGTIGCRFPLPFQMLFRNCLKKSTVKNDMRGRKTCCSVKIACFNLIFVTFFSIVPYSVLCLFGR